MKEIFFILLMFFSLQIFSQSSEGTRVFSGKCAVVQTGSGLGYWQVAISNFNEPGGNYDATDIMAGDYLYFTDNGTPFELRISSILSSSYSNATLIVENVGITSLVAVPTTANAFISRRTLNFKLLPYISNISDNDQQLIQEYNWYKLDSILQVIIDNPLSLTLKFKDLMDTPSSYTGFSQMLVRVNFGETGLEFVADSVLHQIRMGYVDPSPSTPTSPNLYFQETTRKWWYYTGSQWVNVNVDLSANDIPIVDAGNYFTAVNVEEALQELGQTYKIYGVYNNDTHAEQNGVPQGGIYELSEQNTLGKSYGDLRRRRY